jgi:HSP20 family protein
MLMRYDPFRRVDRFTDGLFGSLARTPWMPMDAVRRDDRLELRFDLPGVRPDSIDLTIEGHVLTVKAERSWESPEEGSDVLARERTHGTFTRRVRLGEALDADHVEARYDDGVLHVTVPVAETAKPHKIEIQSGPAPAAVEVGSSN